MPRHMHSHLHTQVNTLSHSQTHLYIAMYIHTLADKHTDSYLPPSKHIHESTCSHTFTKPNQTKPPQLHKLPQPGFQARLGLSPAAGAQTAEMQSTGPHTEEERKEREGDHPNPLPLLGRLWSEARPAAETSGRPR